MTLLELSLVALFVLGVVLSAVYSGSETGIYAVNRLRLDLRAQDVKDRPARVLAKLLNRHEALLCVLLVGNNIANEISTILAEHMVSDFVSDARYSTLVTTAVLTPLLFLFGEALPKQLFRLHAETWAYRITPFLFLSRVVLAPIWLLVLPVARLARRWASGQRSSGMRHDEYALERLLSSVGRKIDPLRQVVLGIGSRRREPVAKVMIPVARARYLPAGAEASDLKSLLRDARHSRYPFRDPDGEFRSYIYFLDPFARTGAAKALGDIARPLAVLAPDTALDEAIGILEESGARVAVVRDEKGATLGFVFAADVVAGLLSMQASASLSTVDSE